MHFCVICRDNKNKKAIERLLTEGASVASIKRKFNYDHRTINKHLKNHMPREVATRLAENAVVPMVDTATEIKHLENLDKWMLYLHSECVATIASAKESGSHSLKLSAIREDKGLLELAFKGKELFFSYHAQSGWQKILPVILKAVEMFPEARLAVSRALVEASREGAIDINPETGE